MKIKEIINKCTFFLKLPGQIKKEIKETPIALTVSIITLVATVVFSGRTLALEHRNAEFDRLLETPCLKSNVSNRVNDVTVNIENVGESTIVIEDIIIKENGVEKPYKDLLDCVEEELPEKDKEGVVIPDQDKVETYEYEGEEEIYSVYIDNGWIRDYQIDLIDEPVASKDSLNLLVFGPSDPENVDAEEKKQQIRAMRHLLKDYEIEVKYRALHQDEDDLSSLIINFHRYQRQFSK